MMKKIIKVLLIGMMVGLLSGCGDPTLDTSSEAAKKESVQKMMDELPPELKADLPKALTGIYMMGMFSSGGSGLSQDEMIANIEAKLDGKTAKEIIIMFKEMENSK